MYVEHSDDVREVVQLVLGEELVVQIEAAEDHVHLGHVVVVVGVKRVVAKNERVGREPGSESKMMQSVRPDGHAAERLVEVLQIALSVDKIIGMRRGRPGAPIRYRSCVIMLFKRVVLPAPLCPRRMVCMTRTLSGQNHMQIIFQDPYSSLNPR